MLSELLRHPVLAIRFIVRRLKEVPTKGLPNLRRAEDDGFDRRFGVETSKVVQIVPTKSPNFSHGVRYSASSESAIRWSIENCGLALDETTFVDVGSGKGRALIVASMYPFKRIIGIEYSPELAAICRNNLKMLSAVNRCEVVVEDAVNFGFPDGNLLAFLYNPFDGTILNRVLHNLAATNGQVRIAQLGPGHEVIQGSGLARRICSGDGPTIYEIVRRRVSSPEFGHIPKCNC
jgi:SAM-dependent methyltransferase